MRLDPSQDKIEWLDGHGLLSDRSVRDCRPESVRQITAADSNGFLPTWGRGTRS